MINVHVDTKIPYDIYIDRGLIDDCAKYVKDLSDAKKVTIVTDSNVAPLYLERVERSLIGEGLEFQTFVYPAGEQSKNLSTINDIYMALADFRMTRKDIILALGGGVCGDMAGFAAATYLRGIGFIQIPTSLLAQVDSSVGGKTGVDIPQGKNLVGAFHQPLCVLIDPDTLDTLPKEFIRDGMGEVIKYGCIKDRELFEKLETCDAMENIDDIIKTCVSIKRDVVSRDEFESGERMLLNFGHTLAHSIEKLNGYTGITHGMAVAVGMVLMTKASENAGLSEKGTADRIASLCRKYSLPVSTDISFKDMAQAAKSDKKTASTYINLVITEKIGSSFTYRIETDELEQFITVS